MRKVLFCLGLFLAGSVTWAAILPVAGCVGDPPAVSPQADDGGGGADADATTTDPADTAPNPTGAANGTACMKDGDCASAHCADGVCCETACSGTCESCGLAEGPGKCLPIPDGKDPAKECVPAALPDAGAPADAGDPGDAGADAGDAAASDSGELNLPDGGLSIDDTKCVGACNGKRACAFPGSTTSCGTQFCNTSTQGAGLSCDGTGHCALGLQACSAYTCTGSSCGTSCADKADCLDTHYCRVTAGAGTCTPKLGNGLTCALSDECKSGFCVTGGGTSVCCTSACNIPGGTCTQSMNVGLCKCTKDCGTGSCRLFYKDSDTDGYGDRDGTVGASTAVVGCDNAAAPAGFVADSTDCDDANSNAHPGQNGYFGSPRSNNSFDYNCDEKVDKQTREVAASCHFCPAPTTVNGKLTCSNASTCTSANQQALLECKLASNLIFCPVGQTCAPSYNCNGQSIFFGTNPYSQGFTSTVACGAFATHTTCGKCTAANGAVTGTTTANKQQLCH